MATKAQLQTNIKKLEAALKQKGIKSDIKAKLQTQLKKSKDELATLTKTGKAPKTSSVAGTKSTLSALQKLVQKKKYSAYKGTGTDLKKDADEGALPFGRRVSQGLKANGASGKGNAKKNKGNVYYEYRVNRADVKQPKGKQSYPKLAGGGMTDLEKKKLNKGGGVDDTPKVYIADLAAYNEGKLIGQWVDLSKFDSGEEVMQEISDLLKKWSKSQGEEREEFAVHDYENFPRSLYSEYMGEKDFDKVIQVYKVAENNDIPMEVVESIMREYSPDDLQEWFDDKFEGQFDSDEELAEHYVEMIGGIENVGKDTLERYFDFERFGRDLAYDYSEFDGYYFRSYKKGGVTDGGMMAKGGRITKGSRWIIEWRDLEGQKGYDILEVVDTDYFSNKYGGSPHTIRTKIVDSSKKDRIGKYDEDGRKSFQSSIKNNIIRKLEDGGMMAKGGGTEKGGEVKPYIMWVSKDDYEREMYGEYKSLRAAKIAMDKVWKSGMNFMEIGIKPKEDYEKEGFYAKGGGMEHGGGIRSTTHRMSK